MFDRKKYMKEYIKQWKKDNPEKVKEQKRRYYKRHSIEIKKYRKDNSEKINAYNKQWQKDNIEKVKETKKKYYKKNKEKMDVWKKQWYADNRESILEKTKQWRKNNQERIKKYKEQWHKKHPGYNNQYVITRRKIDPKFNLNRKISRLISRSLKDNKNGRHWENLIGYNLKDLIKRLEKTIPESYNWGDFMKGKLHIDHKIPISAFNFTNINHIDFQKCWALNNLQLLPAKENIIKSNKLTRPFQPALKI